jgi:hypothetical protein
MFEHMLRVRTQVFGTALISAIMNCIIFLVLRGTLVMKGGMHFHLNPEMRRIILGSSKFEEYHHFIGAIARSMLW